MSKKKCPGWSRPVQGLFIRPALTILIALLTAPSPALAADAKKPSGDVVMADFKNGCAPWDGSTIEIDIPKQVQTPALHITLWGDGVDDLAPGKSVAFSEKDDLNSKSKGSFRQCDDTGLCKATDGQLDITDFRSEDTLEGQALVPQGRTGQSIGVWFRASWHGKKIFCG